MDRPLAVSAELCWRWAFGGVVLLSVALAAAQVLSNVVITEEDQIGLLESGNPQLIGSILSRVFADVGPALAHQLTWLLPLLGFTWLVTAPVGRAAACAALPLPPRASWADLRLRPLWKHSLRLHFIRLVAAVACSFLLSSALAEARYLLVSPAGLVAFTFVAGVVSGAWWMLDFLLAIAPVAFVRGTTQEAAHPVRTLLARWRREPGAYAAVTLQFVGLRGLAFAGWLAASSAALGLTMFFSLPFAVALIGVITLLWCAVDDILWLARLAAYARLDGARSGDEIYLRHVEQGS